MKVHLIRKLAIGKYAEKNIESRKGYQSWLSLLKYADWQHPVDILQTYGSAQLLGNGSNRASFSIGSKGHRLIGKYVFNKNAVMLFVYWMGTNAQYTTLCEERKQFTVCDFETGTQNSISFKVIKTAKQYDGFCARLEELLATKKKSKGQLEEMATLTVLIENHDYAHDISERADPVELVKNLAEYNKDRHREITKMLGNSNELLLDLFGYLRAIPKGAGIKMAERFKLRQEAFNRPYNIFNASTGKVKKICAL